MFVGQWPADSSPAEYSVRRAGAGGRLRTVCPQGKPGRRTGCPEASGACPTRAQACRPKGRRYRTDTKVRPYKNCARERCARLKSARPGIPQFKRIPMADRCLRKS